MLSILSNSFGRLEYKRVDDLMQQLLEASRSVQSTCQPLDRIPQIPTVDSLVSKRDTHSLPSVPTSYNLDLRLGFCVHTLQLITHNKHSLTLYLLL